MNSLKQFFREIKNINNSEKNEAVLSKPEDIEFVSSSNEAVLLDTTTSASLIIWVSFALLAALTIWATVMPIDEVVKAQGSVIPTQHIQRLQAIEAGILQELKVKEGDEVKKGEVLVVIDDSVLESELTDAINQKDALVARLKAIDTHLENKDTIDYSDMKNISEDILKQAKERFYASVNEKQAKIKELDFVIEQKKKDYENATNNLTVSKGDYGTAKEEYSLNKQAYKEQVLSKIELLKFEHQLNEMKRKYDQAQNDVPKAKAAINEAIEHKNGYLTERQNKYTREKTELLSKLESMENKGSGLKDRDETFLIKSPVNGIVKKIHRYTIGSALKAGEDILEIVPMDDTLIIEARVKPQDIGFIRQNLPAKVKLTAYDYATYGGLEGKVEYISADTIVDQKQQSYFIIRIRTEKNSIVDKKGKVHVIIPGMQTESNIVVDQKSILAYIFKKMVQ